MRVLTFTALFPNSVEKTKGIFNFQKMSNFARLPGNEVVVIAPRPFSPGWLGHRWRLISSIPRIERIGELTVYHPRYLLLPQISMPLHGILMFLGSYLLSRRLHRAGAFNCIDAHYVYPDSFAAILIGKLLRVPVIVWAHGSDINLFAGFRTIRPMIRWTLKKAAGCLAVSRALVKRMVELGAAPETSREIGNGVDIACFRPVDRLDARRALGLKQEMLAPEAKLIVCVAALIPLKGHRHLISAIAELAKKYPTLAAYFVGVGPERANLEHRAADRGIAGRIHFAGQRPYDELHLWYSAADVSCLASELEGWPNVLLESLACGTPVVATNVGAVPEVLVSTDLGIIVQQDSRDIHRGLSEALSRNWDHEAIIQYARARTWATVAKEIETALRDFSGKCLTKMDAQSSQSKAT